jgi:hypothetical protein
MGKLNTFEIKAPIRPACLFGMPSSAFQDDTKEGFINLELLKAKG